MKSEQFTEVAPAFCWEVYAAVASHNNHRIAMYRSGISLRGKFCSGTKVLETIISTTIFDVKAPVRTASTINLKTTKVKSSVVIRRFVDEIAQYGECQNCQSTNCESESQRN